MILITGYTGNTGNLVMKKLKAKSNEEIIGLTRGTAYAGAEVNNEIVDLGSRIELEEIFMRYKVTSIIHIANIRYSPLIMELANKYNVPKVILVHTTGIYSKYRSYSDLYKQIEERILEDSYPNTKYTILRPTMIYGNEKDHNMHKLVKFLNRHPLFPIFGSGGALMQPVHVEDLADAIFKAHESDVSQNKDYDLSGGSVVKYKEVLSLITKELGKKVFFIHIPIKLAILAARVYNKLFRKALISVEQVERLQEDKAYSNELAIKEINFTPRPFEVGIREEIKLLKEKGII
jgi:nucleoside-diphosphate-sugar epimerase